MQFKDIVLFLAAAGSAVTALPAPEAEAQDAPVRRAEQAEQGEAVKQGDQFVNPALNGLYPGANLGFQGLQNFQDPRFQDPRFQDPRFFGLNGGSPFFGNFKRDVEAEYNPLARRAEQAEAAKQGKQFFPGFGNQGLGNQWGNQGLGGGNGIVAGGGGGGVILGGQNGFGNNGFGNNGFPPFNRFNQLGGFPGQFGNNFGNNNPFDFFN